MFRIVLHQRAGVRRIRQRGPVRRGQKLHRRLHLVAEILRRVEFRTRNQRAQHRLDVSIGREKRLRHPVHQRRRRIVRHKPLRNLPTDEVRRLRAVRQQIQRFQSLLHSLRCRAHWPARQPSAPPRPDPPIAISSIASRSSAERSSPPALRQSPRPLNHKWRPTPDPVPQPDLRPRLVPLRIELERPPPCPGLFTVQPVRIADRLVTSAWV